MVPGSPCARKPICSSFLLRQRTFGVLPACPRLPPRHSFLHSLSNPSSASVGSDAHHLSQAASPATASNGQTRPCTRSKSPWLVIVFRWTSLANRPSLNVSRWPLLLATGYWLLAAGYWLLPAPCLQVHQLHVINFPPQKPASQRSKLLYRICREKPSCSPRSRPVPCAQLLPHLLRRHLR